jgi:CDP-glycerol glycerophosphotransferase (TagB/SpsB family)
MQEGASANQVEVTGNAQCDEMHKRSRASWSAISAFKASLGLPQDRPILVFAHEHTGRIYQLEPSAADDADRAILEAMRVAAPAAIRVIKMHPKEGSAEMAKLRAMDPAAVIVGSEVDLGQLVAASDLVLSVLSSSLLWAIGINRPAISAFLWPNVHEMRRARIYTGVENADSVEELVRAIRRNLHDQAHIDQWRERRAACQQEFLRLDGKSMERIVPLIGRAATVRTRSSGVPAIRSPARLNTQTDP